MYILVHEDFTTTKQRCTQLEIRIRDLSYFVLFLEMANKNRYNDLPNEGGFMRPAILMAIAGAFIMFGYEIVRSASNTLSNRDFGVGYQPVVMSLIPFFLFVVLYFYNRILDRFGAHRGFLLSIILSMVALFGCWIGINLGYRFCSGLLYLCREVYIVIIVEHIWSFINSISSESEAKVINGRVLLIATIGAVIGGVFVHQYAKAWGTQNLLIAILPVCAVALLLSHQAYSRALIIDASKFMRKKKSSSILSFDEFRENRILVSILFLVVASQFYGTLVTLVFQNSLVAGFSDPDAQTAFSGLFFALLNGVSLFLQGVLTPLFLRHFQIFTIQLVVVIVNLATIIAAFWFGGIYTAAVSLLFFKAFDYSLFRSSKEIYYIPLSFESRYKAKALIDVFAYRCSKGGATACLSVAQLAGLALSSASLSALGVFFGVMWLLSLVPLYQKEEREPIVVS